MNHDKDHVEIKDQNAILLVIVAEGDDELVESVVNLLKSVDL